MVQRLVLSITAHHLLPFGKRVPDTRHRAQGGRPAAADPVFLTSAERDRAYAAGPEHLERLFEDGVLVRRVVLGHGHGVVGLDALAVDPRALRRQPLRRREPEPTVVAELL